MSTNVKKDFEEERNKQVSKTRSILDYIMGIVIVTVGVFLMIRHKFNLPINKKFPPDMSDIAIGCVFILYGAWRVYRGNKKNYFK